MKGRTKIAVTTGLVATAILAWLLLIPRPLPEPPGDERKKMYTMSAIIAYDQALSLSHKPYGRYPSSEEGLVILVTEKIILRITPDKWGQEFVYTNPSSREGKKMI